MAQVVQVVMSCDLDDEEGEDIETITYAYEGNAYEFDACTEHRREFNELIRGYVDISRRVSGKSTRAYVKRPTKAVDIDLKEVRAWAREQGMTVSSRGRVPVDVQDAFKKAHAKKR